MRQTEIEMNASLDLGNRDVLTALDPLGMLALIEDFPDQCRRAYAIASAAEIPSLNFDPAFAVLSGMGGSAAGGDFVKAVFEAEGTIPFQVIRDYDVPNAVGPNTVVFIASYSGNTEETLSAYEQATERGAHIIVVSSGGKISELAQQRNQTLITVPGGQPPRSALGYMLIPVLVACEKLGLIPAQPYESAFALLDKVTADLGPDAPSNEAMALANQFHGKIGLCYGLGGYRGYIANRWRCQFNENAKYLLFANSYPELCHNEIVGWVEAKQQADAFFGVVLQDGTEPERMRVRAKVTGDVIGADVATFAPVHARGEALLERLLTLTFIGDWVSIYLARLNGADPTQIANIDTLKTELAKLGE
jgi:glucose/mannose-6-phosphate isomerase